MSANAIQVLLVGDGAKGSTLLLNFLQKRGCDCYFSKSGAETEPPFPGSIFDLVLCTDWVEGIQDSIDAFIGPKTTLFRCHAVEDGCWWLPVTRFGEKCLGGAPALDPSQFASALEYILGEIRQNQSKERPEQDSEKAGGKRQGSGKSTPLADG